jgi:hypothetical protein
MDLGRISELSLHVQHRHSDGSWSDLQPSSAHHDPAAHDPERDWANGTIYVCTSCNEEVLVSTDAPADQRG